jgi:hypothetical protein
MKLRWGVACHPHRSSLVDVDNTLIDNDGLQQDLKDHLSVYGRASRERY